MSRRLPNTNAGTISISLTFPLWVPVKLYLLHIKWNSVANTDRQFHRFVFIWFCWLWLWPELVVWTEWATRYTVCPVFNSNDSHLSFSISFVFATFSSILVSSERRNAVSTLPAYFVIFFSSFGLVVPKTAFIIFFMRRRQNTHNIVYIFNSNYKDRRAFVTFARNAVKWLNVDCQIPMKFEEALWMWWQIYEHDNQYTSVWEFAGNMLWLTFSRRVKRCHNARMGLFAPLSTFFSHYGPNILTCVRIIIDYTTLKYDAAF